MADFNSDNQKTDAALHGLAEQLSGKAPKPALTAAVNRVTALENGKADKTALEAEAAARQSADSAEQAAREALAAVSGNCEMELITYTGTGVYSSAPTQITFSQTPEVYIVAGDLALVIGHSGESKAIQACRSTSASNSFITDITGTWNGSTLSLINYTDARYQMNTAGKFYWALGLRRKQ